jgi:exopolysaccharide biosynthesis predicted pyruvyltransferase EpsI
MTAQADRTAPEAAGAGLVTRLGETIASRLRGFVAPGQDFALLDFPDHSNVGDSAIWLGELAAFRALGGGAPGYVATKDAFDAEALRRAVPDGPIFLHGGGNFGDLWPEHQLFRERILAQFPDRAIVQLPQTVHFAAQVARDRAAAAIAAHPRFVLMVRDAASQALAESRFDCAVHPVPDMAFALGAQSGAAAPTVRLLLLLRTDKERAAGLHAAPPALPAGALVRDWLDEPPRLHDRAAWRTRLAAPFLLGTACTDPARRRELLFRDLAARRLARGLGMLSAASFVITDRLHCHILCLLLGVPHIVLDNSYGKLSGFIGAWTRECGLVRMVPTLDAALALWAAEPGDAKPGAAAAA